MDKRSQTIQKWIRRRWNVQRRLLTLSVCASVLLSGTVSAAAFADGGSSTVTKILICTLPEGDGHHHTRDCYTRERGALICTDTSSNHIHTDDCYEWTYTLSCGLEEGEGAHTHTDSCYKIVTDPIQSGSMEGETFEILEPGELSAQDTETNENTDISLGIEAPVTASEQETEASPSPSQQTEKNPQATKKPQEDQTEEFSLPAAFRLPEGYGAPGASWPVWEEEFERPLGPTSVLPEQMMLVFAEQADPYADLEDEEFWDEMFADLELSGNWAQDLVTVAESQLGYTESTLNYAIAYDQTVKGYTRYGAWYGIPYGDWCAMFISFCLHYAQIPWSAFPYSCHCVIWTNELDALGLFHRVDNKEDPYEPKAGDLIFFDYDLDGRADHAGIVTGHNYEAGTIYTIEGNRFDYVERFELIRNDYTIMGYGEMPENPRQGLVTLGRTDTGVAAVTTVPASGSTTLPTPDNGPASAADTAGETADGTRPIADIYYPTLPDAANQDKRPGPVDAAAEDTASENAALSSPAEACVLDEVIRMKTAEISPTVELTVIQTMA